LDLGQAADFSALAVLERAPGQSPAQYACRHLQRWPLGTSYPAIVDDVVQLTAAAPLAGCTLAVDGTGCGRAVVDLFRRAPGRQGTLTPVLITAGHDVRQAEDGYLHVAKVQLVSTLQVLLQSRRLKIARALKLARTVERELANFRVKITAAANETFAGDWREGEHDDLVLAVALAAYLAERGAGLPWEVVAADPRDQSLFAPGRVPEGVFLSDDRDRCWRTVYQAPRLSS
jgi:hypothetical protein